MTNLLATIVITLITNTVETPLDFEPAANQYVIGHAVKKETITTVRELQTCRFEWAGKVREIHESRMISEERKVLKLEWVTVRPEPPMPEVPWFGVLGAVTNISRMLVITNGSEPSFVYQTNRGKLIWNH